MKYLIKKSAVNLFTIIFILLVASPGYSQNDNQARNISDTTITNNAIKKISNSVFYGIFDWVDVHCNNGVVKLEGWVHLPWLKPQLQEAVEKIPGVKSVNNQINTTFVPGEIGVRAARLIYNSPFFISEAFSPNSPVHIIVNNDIIILEGTVSTEAQKDQAEYLAGTFTNAFKVQNNLKVDANKRS